MNFPNAVAFARFVTLAVYCGRGSINCWSSASGLTQRVRCGSQWGFLRGVSSPVEPPSTAGLLCASVANKKCGGESSKPGISRCESGRCRAAGTALGSGEAALGLNVCCDCSPHQSSHFLASAVAILPRCRGAAVRWLFARCIALPELYHDLDDRRLVRESTLSGFGVMRSHSWLCGELPLRR
jgi:hypothetical protein